MTKRQIIAGLIHVIEDRDAAIERLHAARRADAARHESTLRDLDAERSRVAELEAAAAVDDAYAGIFARYEGLA